MAACLYEGISGRRAFPGDDAIKVARSIEKDPPLPIADALGLSPRVDTALLKAMSLDPRRRYTTCREFGLALSEALLGLREGQPTLPETNAAFPIEIVNKRWSLGSAVLFLLIGATIATAIFKFLHHPLRETRLHTLQESSVRPAYISPLPKKK
jgi:hypothetical protein